MANDKQKGEAIFKRDLEINKCGYKSVCPIKNCVDCCITISKTKFNYEAWEEMRKGIEGKYKDFWRKDDE